MLRFFTDFRDANFGLLEQICIELRVSVPVEVSSLRSLAVYIFKMYIVSNKTASQNHGKYF